tara:strand:- start:4800 stop:5936 length:1137 start_codon:yes stop_codon:yes gene_type:complete
MNKQKHSMQPIPSHDESVRQDFVTDFRAFLTDELYPKITPYYESRIEPAFVKENGRSPQDKKEVQDIMLQDSAYQSWSFLQRISQQMMFTSVIDTVERTLEELIEKTKDHSELGSLELDKSLEIPRYLTAYDIHQQPGGYHTENVKNDISAGVVYDISLPIYSQDAMGDENDLLAQATINFIKKNIHTSPKKILDMGCYIGNSTLPFVRAFPESEVYGIDIAAPGLRYAHARANALNGSVHFSQQNAEAMSFESNTFDIVTSCLFLHETSHAAIPKIINECSRVLKPGGWMIHMDVYPFQRDVVEPLYDFLKDWEVINNNEDFSGALREMDLRGIFEEAGFSKETIEFTSAEASSEINKGYTGDFYLKLPVYVAQKTA